MVAERVLFKMRAMVKTIRNCFKNNFVILLVKLQVMKNTFLFAFAVLVSASLFAQKNVVKVKPIKPIIQSVLGTPPVIPISYERVLIPRLSAQVNFEYAIESEVTLDQIDFGNLNLPTSLSGVRFGGEVRFYPNLLKKTPKGIYVAGLVDYNSMNLTSSFNYNRNFNTGGIGVSPSIDLDVEGDLRILQYGIALGTQYLVAGKIANDITWISIGWGSLESDLDLMGNFQEALQNEVDAAAAANGVPSTTVELGQNGAPDWSFVADEFNSINADIPLVKPEFSATSSANGAKGKVSANLPMIRPFGISIGFAF